MPFSRSFPSDRRTLYLPILSGLTRRIRVRLLVLTGAAVLLAAVRPLDADVGAPVVGGCPPEHAEAREMAIAFLEGFSEEAGALGLSAADTLQLRLLADPGDAYACEQLQLGLAAGDAVRYPYVHSFYQVRGYYLVGSGVHPSAGTQINPDGTVTVRLRRSYVAVVDSAFRVVGAYAM